MKRGGLAVLLLALLLGVTPVVGADERPLVVVLKTGTAEPYARALVGLREQLGDGARLEVTMIERDDPGEAERVQKLEPDVLVALGSQATLWAMDQVDETPIVFAMVLHPVSSALVDSLQRPGGRVTGAALDISASRQFEALRDVVGAKRVAVLYDPNETADLIEDARVAARRSGIELMTISVAGPKALERALQRVDDSVDALWSVADRTVMSRGAAERVLVHTLRHGIPFVGLSEQFVRAGALMALVSSYEHNGQQAGELVQRVLAGRSPSSLPVALPERVEIVFNPRTAKRLKFELAPETRASLRAVR